LSEARAKACYDYLVSKGIAANRMSHTGFGETKPKGDNSNAAGNAKNRRVEFELSVK
jgi:outer membrane protein OmpA-like peptidoglycan-associated protein